MILILQTIWGSGGPIHAWSDPFLSAQADASTGTHNRVSPSGKQLLVYF